MHVHVLPNHHANVISQKICRMLEVVILCYKYQRKCQLLILLYYTVRLKHQLECELCKIKLVILNICWEFWIIWKWGIWSFNF